MERAATEREEATRSQLKSYDNGLDLRWFPAIRRYAVVATWPMDDARWQLYRNGETEDACDILGWFSVDSADADTPAIDVDAFEARLFEILGKSDNLKTPWKARLKEIAEKNRKIRQKAKQEILDQVEMIAKDLEYMAGHNEEVRMRRIMKDIAKEGFTNV